MQISPNFAILTTIFFALQFWNSELRIYGAYLYLIFPEKFTQRKENGFQNENPSFCHHNYLIGLTISIFTVSLDECKWMIQFFEFVFAIRFWWCVIANQLRRTAVTTASKNFHLFFISIKIWSNKNTWKHVWENVECFTF